MRYFIDTEFIEKYGKIDLISIGIISEEGQTYYAENACFEERDADEWIKENVISNLKWYRNENEKKGFCNASTLNALTSKATTEIFGTPTLIKETIVDFICDDIPEFWGYYSAYDWVAFCGLFGRMIDLPKQYLMYCNDLKQWKDYLSNKGFKTDFVKTQNHNALDDAKWNKQLWIFLNNLEK
jgi:hypothetical protein